MTIKGFLFPLQRKMLAVTAKNALPPCPQNQFKRCNCPLVLTRFLRPFPLSLALALFALPVFADQVEMQNGDRYVGKVLSLNSDTLILQNDVLGTMHLPRSKVTSINLGSVLPQTTRPQVAAGAGGHSPRPTA